MTSAQASALLDRYFAGESTLAEEAQLRHYFCAGDVDPDLAHYAPLFAYWTAASDVTAPRKSRPARRLPLRWLAAVAVALALVLVANGWQRPTQPLSAFPIAEAKPVDWSKYEITDQKEAYRVLRAALKTASTELNRGPRITVRELRQATEALR
ncbi:hypothetical protein QWY85_13240 [Neolewinella lacunae]|uniref:Uncharacterized protein n=1 Tax=Neolewinella lacunae TaxID=1517758 RepID=A0A923TE68_9BACT|nr:hypothetical protein [Neolewinella lacunae]MBC6995592.1 hypothetical protein [Neolewinella lacunae]MDN3635628.1 hypothetical protein [Neolewinella lacunae]